MSVPAHALNKVIQRRGSSTRPGSDTASLATDLRKAADLLRTGRPAEAEPILRRLISAAPQNPDAHNLLGIILDQRSQFKDAEREYRAALQLNQIGRASCRERV